MSCAGGVVGKFGLAGAVVPFWATCVPGEEENLDEILDSQEFLRVVPGEGEAAFGEVPFNVEVLSVEVVLAKPGR